MCEDRFAFLVKHVSTHNFRHMMERMACHFAFFCAWAWFSPVCWKVFFCLFVNKITQKPLNRLPQNLGDECSICQSRTCLTFLVCIKNTFYNIAWAFFNISTVHMSNMRVCYKPISALVQAQPLERSRIIWISSITATSSTNEKTKTDVGWWGFHRKTNIQPNCNRTVWVTWCIT